MRCKAKLAGLYVGAMLSAAVLFLSLQASGRNPTGFPPDRDDRTRLTIEVTAGDLNKPVDQASVYVKFPTDPKNEKGKLIELNLKTNQQGTTRSPDIPQGKVLVQIIAPGWKTFGQWYEISQPEQKIEIHLVRPERKWF
jgi:hypothetical protein